MIVRVFPTDASGCGQYRIVYPSEAVAKLSTDVEIQTVWHATDDLALDVRLAGKLGNERVVSVVDPECDVIVMQRPAHRHLCEAIPHIQAHGTAVVCEYDDDFDTIDPRNRAYLAYEPRHNPMQNKIWAKLASSLADLVTVTTPALAKRYGAHGRVAVIPNYVPAAYLDVQPMWNREDDFCDDGSVRIGWAGNPFTHPGDLEVMGDSIANVVADENAIFRTIGSAETPAVVGLSESSAEVMQWTHIDEFFNYVASFDVGVVPLRDSTFNKAKSALKGLEYAALGVPFVASPTRPYQELSRAGAGDLVGTTTRNTDSWQRALTRLVGDDEYRKLRAEEGRIVAAELTYEKNSERWLTAWENALSMRRAR